MVGRVKGEREGGGRKEEKRRDDRVRERETIMEGEEGRMG